MHGFELVKEQFIPEINTRAKLYRHVKTGAQLLSMENDDENKVFGISFYTPPEDSTGVAHILEHSVLCGSRKYPVKEPFVELLKGSLNTFVNAFTFADKTVYPCASQNVKDFYNLIDVYIDAVFYPRITPAIFQQEGWHYELDNPDEPLSYKGVVFNEMKGVYSSPEQILNTYSQTSLFPDTRYGVDSGGNPQVIPNLTYEQFKAFHSRYYHPSNALIWFYGDDAPEERLRYMDGLLSEFEPVTLDKTLKRQPRFSEPRRLSIPYDAGEEASKGQVTVNWLLTETSDIENNLGLQILSYLLTGSPASPLRKALIDSGLGEGLTGAGIEDQVVEMFYSTGLKGIDPENAQQVEQLILDTLAGLVKNGIEPEMVEAALNTIEFRMRENNTGSFPRGLALMINALSTWLYGGDPLAAVAFEAPLNAIKTHVVSGERYFEGLIEKFLLNNPHRTTVSLYPDPEEHTRLEAVERERLDQARGSMGADQIKQVVENTEALKRAQETPDTPEALATLPTLTLDDLDKKNKTIPISVSEEKDTKVVYHDLFTNGIMYLDLGFDLHSLPQDLLPYVNLFSRALLEMGTQTEDYVKLSQRIGRKTGGIRAANFTSLVKHTDRATAWLFLRCKGTPAQADDLFAILRDIITTVKLDNPDRFRQIVLQEKASREGHLVPSGHAVAYTRLKSHFNEADWASEQMGGISYLLFVRELVEKIDQDWPSVVEKLEKIRKLLANRTSMIANVTIDGTHWKELCPRLVQFLDTLPEARISPTAWKPVAPPAFEGLTIPAQVNYVAKGADVYKLGYEPDGSHLAITNYIRTTWLWEKVRVQGGAYGGFLLFDEHTGSLGYVSYRDPNLLETLANYDGTAQFLESLDLSDEELKRSIIGAIGDMDAYQLPDAKGYTSLLRWLIGETDAERQQKRDEVLSTTVNDFRQFGRVLEQVSRQGVVTVIGSADTIEAANAERGGNWLQVQKVL